MSFEVWNVFYLTYHNDYIGAVMQGMSQDSVIVKFGSDLIELSEATFFAIPDVGSTISEDFFPVLPHKLNPGEKYYYVDPYTQEVSLYEIQDTYFLHYMKQVDFGDTPQDCIDILTSNGSGLVNRTIIYVKEEDDTPIKPAFEKPLARRYLVDPEDSTKGFAHSAGFVQEAVTCWSHTYYDDQLLEALVCQIVSFPFHTWSGAPEAFDLGEMVIDSDGLYYSYMAEGAGTDYSGNNPLQEGAPLRGAMQVATFPIGQHGYQYKIWLGDPYAYERVYTRSKAPPVTGTTGGIIPGFIGSAFVAGFLGIKPYGRKKH